MRPSSAGICCRVAIVVLALAAGCGEPPSQSLSAVDQAIAAGRAPTDAPPLDRYAMLATATVKLGEHSVVEGAIGVSGSDADHGRIVVGRSATVAIDDALVAKCVVLHDRARVGAVAADHVHARDATTGARSPFVAPPMAPSARTAADVNARGASVPARRTEVLAPGRYGDVSVEGHLQLAGGIYEVRSVRIAAGGRLTALSTATLRVSRGLAAEDRAQLVAASGRAADLRVVVGHSVRFAREGRMVALVIAREAFRAGPRLVAAGAVAAAEIEIGERSRWTHDSGFACASSTACEASAACVRATCVDARCEAIPAPNGTACDDGDVCSVGDACHAGACAPGAPLVTEIAAGGATPTGLAVTDDGDVWFALPESSPGATDGSVRRVSAATGAVTTYPTSRKLLHVAAGRHEDVWLTGRLPPDESSLWTIGHLLAGGSFGQEIVGIPADRVAIAPNDDLWFAGTVDAGDASLDQHALVGSLRGADGVVSALLLLRSPARAMTFGPDGRLWIAASNGRADGAFIARVDADGAVTEFPVTTSGHLNAIAAGRDGDLWFTDAGNDRIGRITVDGVMSAFAGTSASAGVAGIAVAGDGTVWFTERRANRLGRIAASGEVTELACIPTVDAEPTEMAVGRDGRLWFVESAAARVAHLRAP